MSYVLDKDRVEGIGKYGLGIWNVREIIFEITARDYENQSSGTKISCWRQCLEEDYEFY